jgi:hypothetical protein
MKGRAASTPQPPPWWSAADQAEWELLAAEFVDAAIAHDQRCPTCSVRGPSCAAIREGYEALEQWREGRELRSKAAWLRARQDFSEASRAA